MTGTAKEVLKYFCQLVFYYYPNLKKAGFFDAESMILKEIDRIPADNRLNELLEKVYKVLASYFKR